VTGVDERGERPVPFELFQNFPDPFNSSTTIRYGLPFKSSVSLSVYNALGANVATLVQRDVDPGLHEVRFDASSLPSGVYFYRIIARGFRQTRRLVLLR
jgi:hypothetical protein